MTCTTVRHAFLALAVFSLSSGCAASSAEDENENGASASAQTATTLPCSGTVVYIQCYGADECGTLGDAMAASQTKDDLRGLGAKVEAVEDQWWVDQQRGRRQSIPLGRLIQAHPDDLACAAQMQTVFGKLAAADHTHFGYAPFRIEPRSDGTIKKGHVVVWVELGYTPGLLP